MLTFVRINDAKYKVVILIPPIDGLALFPAYLSMAKWSKYYASGPRINRVGLVYIWDIHTALLCGGAFYSRAIECSLKETQRPIVLYSWYPTVYPFSRNVILKKEHSLILPTQFDWSRQKTEFSVIISLYTSSLGCEDLVVKAELNWRSVWK